MKYKKSYLILLISICSFYSVQSQNNGAKKEIASISLKQFTIKELQADFRQMLKIIDENHPALYEFIDKRDYNAFCEQQYKSIEDSLSIHDFYTICSSVIAKTGSVHSGMAMPAEFYRNPAAIKVLPLIIKWIDDKMYVVKVLGNNKIDTGVEVLGINGIPISEIYKTLYSTTSADGLNSSHISSYIGENFFEVYTLNYGLPEEFKIKYKNPGSSVQYETTCSPIEYAQIRNYYSQRSYSCDSLCFKVLDNNAAMITIPSFEFRSERYNIFQNFIEKSFTKINNSKIENVIIDLRGNSGGGPFCAAYLLSYFIEEPTPFFAGSYNTKGVSYDSLYKPVLPNQNRFNGEVYILIDGLGLSSTGFFCSLMKYHRLAEFVGEELGSTYFTTADFGVFSLKNTGLRMRIARAKRCTAVEGFNKERGILPDYEVKPKIDDLINDNDAVLNYTKKLINNK